MSQLPGFSKYMKFSEIEVDQDFTRNMKHLNEKSTDPESYEWFLDKIKMQSSQEIPVTAMNHVAKATIQPSWELCYNGEHALYEKRDINVKEAHIELPDTTPLPVTLKAEETFYFYHDDTILEPGHEDTESAQFLKTSSYFLASTEQQTFYNNLKISYCNMDFQYDLIDNHYIFIYPDQILLQQGEDPSKNISITNNDAINYLKIELGEERAYTTIPLTFVSKIDENIILYESKQKNRYLGPSPDSSERLQLEYCGNMSIIEGTPSFGTLNEPILWTKDSIFSYQDKIYTLGGISHIDYDGTITSEFKIIVPKTVVLLGNEDVDGKILSNYTGILDISYASSGIQIAENGFEACSHATLYMNQDQYTELQSRIVEGKLDGLIPVQVKSGGVES